MCLEKPVLWQYWVGCQEFLDVFRSHLIGLLVLGLCPWFIVFSWLWYHNKAVGICLVHVKMAETRADLIFESIGAFHLIPVLWVILLVDVFIGKRDSTNGELHLMSDSSIDWLDLMPSSYQPSNCHLLGLHLRSIVNSLLVVGSDFYRNII